MDNNLPAGYGIRKGPFCDNCPAFTPMIHDPLGRTFDGKYSAPDVVCEHYTLCKRAYEIGQNEKNGDA